MKSELLDSLYQKYNISNLNFGAIHDKLGDVYEEYCTSILNDPKHLGIAKNGVFDNSTDHQVFLQLLHVYKIDDFSQIESIEATTKVPHRDTRGLSKTDIIFTIKNIDQTETKFAVSCKQSTVPKVAVAEFDVDTICKEVGINDDRLKALLLKHQTDKSAKNFTAAEKIELKNLLAPIAREFVRWVITGNPTPAPENLAFPTSIIKFKVKKPLDKSNINIDNGDFSLMSFSAYSIEDYVDSIMYTPNGNLRAGGFGTGLSWTYATGSGGFKIQFKA